MIIQSLPGVMGGLDLKQAIMVQIQALEHL